MGGNQDSMKDLKGHKNLWLTIISPLMAWHPHLVKRPTIFTPRCLSHSSFLSLLEKTTETSCNNAQKEKEGNTKKIQQTASYASENNTRMSEVKDSAIKLFGKTIPFSVVSHHHHQQQQQEVLANDQSYSADDHGSCDRNLETSLGEENSNKEQQEEQEQEHKENSGKEIIEDKQEDGSSKQTTTSSGNTDDNPKTPSVDRETSSLKSSKNGEQSERSNSQEKTLKKPDKILPCPRCNSMDTKFCYYNNYNVNQPRHFCKKCQRYWTAGGTMRNVPVGAGRRKNKSSSVSHFRQIVISEALRTVQANASNGINNPSFGNSGTVLTFGSDSPLCESMASALNLTNKTQNCERNGFHRPEQRSLASPGGRDNREDHSSGSLLTASNSSGKGGNLASQDLRTRNYQGSAPQLPYFPGPPWPYPWNTPMPPPPAFYPSGFPISFYPETTYWGCTVPGPWNMPFVSPNSSSFSQYPPYSSPASPTLGKHSRDGNIITPTNSEKEESSRGSNSSERSVLVPKTLRIDDPSEAAKSSIWATLGIKNEKTNTGEGLFKGFQSKSDHKRCKAETSAVLQANPAALSRSLKFHETT